MIIAFGVLGTGDGIDFGGLGNDDHGPGLDLMRMETTCFLATTRKVARLTTAMPQEAMLFDLLYREKFYSKQVEYRSAQLGLSSPNKISSTPSLLAGDKPSTFLASFFDLADDASRRCGNECTATTLWIRHGIP